MTVCCCSLAGTAACRTCSNNPNAETPPPVRTYTVSATNTVLITGQKTNADRIRSMTDEELAAWISEVADDGCGMCAPGHYDCAGKDSCAPCWLEWLKQEVTTNSTT